MLAASHSIFISKHCACESDSICDPAQCLCCNIHSPTRDWRFACRGRLRLHLWMALSLCQLHLFISLSCGCPWGASPRSRAIAFDRIRAYQFSSSSLSRLVCPPQFSSLFLVLSSPYYLPVLLPLAAVAWSSFRQSIGNSLPLCSPLLSTQLFSLSNLRAGSICLFFGISDFAIHVLFSLFLSFSLLFIQSFVRMSSLTAVLPPSSRALFQSNPP